MPSTSPSFVIELPLIVDSGQEKELLSRFQSARQLYNALLGEAEKRRNLLKKSSAYQEALNTSRNNKKTRNILFKKARQEYRYTEYDLQALATIISKGAGWIADKLDSNTQQTLATRAFRASERVLLSKAKKVRYKVPNRFRSVEGKTNKQGIRWKDDNVIWGSLKLRPVITNDPVILHGLNSRIKLVRILWRELNGKRRWYAQLVCEGISYQKPANYVSDGLIGLDLNVNCIAFVGDEEAGLLPFAENVPSYSKEIKTLQRKMERSRRANNPDNYHPDTEGRRGRKSVIKKGKNKKGKRAWKNSQSYLRTARKKREIERKRKAYARTKNRQLVNEILRHGNRIKTERVSVKSWQRRYGKAISAKSPSFVESELRRKAESAGGSFTRFSTQRTALSQTHLDGTRIKKSLSVRVHHDVTGIPAHHRDLFSAFLSRYVNDDGEFSLRDAQFEYPGSEPRREADLVEILLGAWEQYQQTANRVSESESG